VSKSKVTLAALVGATCLLAFCALAAAQAVDVDLVFLVDESGSLCNSGPPPYPPGNVAVEVDGFIAALDNVIVPWVAAGGAARVAVVSFSDSIYTHIGLTDVATGRAAIVAALNAIKTHVNGEPECGLTNLGGAVAEAKAILDGSTAPLRIVNLATNGSPTIGPPFLDACAGARAAGHQIWALGIGNADQAALEGCVDDPARYFYAPTAADFAAVEERKLEEVIGPPPGPGPGRPRVGITADYKAELAREALGLKDEIGDLIDTLRRGLVGEKVEDGLLLCTKSWIIRARKELEEGGGGDPAAVRRKIQSAQRCKQEAYGGLPAVGGLIDELEGSIDALILEMEGQIAAGEITQDEARHLKEAYLSYLLARLTEKEILLIELDRELERVDEHLAEAEALLREGAFGEAADALAEAERGIKRVISKVWELKEQMKYVLGYTEGFVVAVLAAPVLPPPPPRYGSYHPPFGLAVGAVPPGGAVRFAASGPVAALRVEVFALDGREVFDSGFVMGTTFEWPLLDKDGHAVANGVYLYLATVRNPDGELIQSGLHKLAVVR